MRRDSYYNATASQVAALARSMNEPADGDDVLILGDDRPDGLRETISYLRAHLVTEMTFTASPDRTCPGCCVLSARWMADTPREALEVCRAIPAFIVGDVLLLLSESAYRALPAWEAKADAVGTERVMTALRDWLPDPHSYGYAMTAALRLEQVRRARIQRSGLEEIGPGPGEVVAFDYMRPLSFAWVTVADSLAPALEG